MNEENQQLAAFKKELKALLNKHCASIEAAYEGDSQGIYQEKLVVTFYEPENKQHQWVDASPDYTLVDNFWLSEEDL